MGKKIRNSKELNSMLQCSRYFKIFTFSEGFCKNIERISSMGAKQKSGGNNCSRPYSSAKIGQTMISTITLSFSIFSSILLVWTTIQRLLSAILN
jgi:hypothetical protein